MLSLSDIHSQITSSYRRDDLCAHRLRGDVCAFHFAEMVDYVVGNGSEHANPSGRADCYLLSRWSAKHFRFVAFISRYSRIHESHSFPIGRGDVGSVDFIKSVPVDWLLSGLAAGRHISLLAQAGLSLNRFFTINFNGLYYQKTERRPHLQAFLSFTFGALFECWNSWIHEHFDLITVCFAYEIPFSLIASSSFTLDLIVFYRLKTNRLVSGLVKRTEMFLISQMILNHVLFLCNYHLQNIVLLSLFSMAPMKIVYARDFFEIAWVVFMTFSGMLTIYCFRRARKKQHSRNVFIQNVLTQSQAGVIGKEIASIRNFDIK